MIQGRKTVEELRKKYESEGLSIYHPPDVGIQLRDFSKDAEIGKRFGKLVVLGWQFRAPNYVWKVVCKCDCKRVSVHRVSDLAKGGSKSCGCGFVLARTAGRSVHGESGTRLYWIWCAMKSRCLNPNDQSFYRYGGKGIKICKEWIKSYLIFAKWARKSGYGEKKELTRRDMKGDFCPENCIWEDRVYIRNRVANNRILTLNGRSMTIAQWSRRIGIKDRTLTNRVRLGWSDERALTEPVAKVGRGAS